MTIKRKHVGQSLDDFLKEQGIFEETQKIVTKKRIAVKIQREMKKAKMSKTKLAEILKTSRAQVDRILSPEDSVTLDTLESVALAFGCSLNIDFVPLVAHHA